MQYGDALGKLNKSHRSAHKILEYNNVDVYEFIYHVVEILYIECYYQLPKYRRMNYK